MTIPQPENRSAQDDVDRIMVSARLNESIAGLLRVREYFFTHHPTKGRDDAIAAIDRSLKSLRDHLDVLDAEIRKSPHDQHIRPDRGHPKSEL